MILPTINSEKVPIQCYLAFFDNVYTFLTGELSFDTPEALVPTENCVNREITVTLEQKNLVPELSKSEVLNFIGKGQNVLFIDVREKYEFQENHIPGAVNYSIKDIDKINPEQLSNHDLIITYCVKDFRGYEMAKLLRKKGYTHTAIMNPYGLRGWIDAGLPLYKKGENSEKKSFLQKQSGQESKKKLL